MSAPVVLITGALTGIGGATALAFAHEGARLVVSGRREEAGEALAAKLRAFGNEAEFVRADVRHEDDVRELVDRTVARFGRIDVAVNNAGTEGTPGALTAQSAETYAATFDTNVLGTLLSLKHELRVNAVAPGPVDTDMLNRFTGNADRMAKLIAGVPARRAGRPEEIAQTIVFLASGKAGFITGQIVGVDGGKTAP